MELPETVRINLSHFRDLITSPPRDQLKEGEHEYTVLINCHSGEMRFAQVISDLNFVNLKKGSLDDWTEARLIVSIHAASHEVHFAIQKRAPVHSLDPLAQKVTQQTIHYLNDQGKNVRWGKEQNLQEQVLRSLAPLLSGVVAENLAEDPHWKPGFGRVEAENALRGKPRGFYILRKGDPLDVTITKKLEEANHLLIQPFILTMVNALLKIEEHLILQTNRGWMIYSDEPRLDRVQIYPSLHDLLHSLSL